MRLLVVIASLFCLVALLGSRANVPPGFGIYFGPSYPYSYGYYDPYYGYYDPYYGYPYYGGGVYWGGGWHGHYHH